MRLLADQPRLSGFYEPAERNGNRTILLNKAGMYPIVRMSLQYPNPKVVVWTVYPGLPLPYISQTVNPQRLDKGDKGKICFHNLHESMSYFGSIIKKDHLKDLGEHQIQ